MKGFGNNEQLTKSQQKKKLMVCKDNYFNEYPYTQVEKLKKHKIYNFLIQNKIYDPRVLNNLGSLYSQLKQFDKAILLFYESIKRFPNSLEAYTNLANILVAKGKSNTAKNILNKAIELNPKYLRSYSILAGILVGEGDLKKAAIFLKKSLEINPKDIALTIYCVLKD